MFCPYFHNLIIHGLLRASHSHNPSRHLHIVKLTLHFYAHIGVRPKVFPPPVLAQRWGNTLGCCNHILQ
nr:hypothetical protein [uncultured Eubacterium sp.]